MRTWLALAFLGAGVLEAPAVTLTLAFPPAMPGVYADRPDPVRSYVLLECTLHACPPPAMDAPGWAPVAEGLECPSSSECRLSATRTDPTPGTTVAALYAVYAVALSGAVGPPSPPLAHTLVGPPKPPGAPGLPRLVSVPLVIGPAGNVRVADAMPPLKPREGIAGCVVKADRR